MAAYGEIPTAAVSLAMEQLAQVDFLAILWRREAIDLAP
jgi:hypothetical protein